jgi:hypothetical protein
MSNILILFIILLPWSRNPYTGTSFLVPLATGFAVISVLPVFITNFWSYIRSSSTSKLPFIFLIYCLISFPIGYFNLSDLDKLHLVFLKSESVSYLETGSKKLIQILYAFSAYYVFSEIRPIYIRRFLAAWKIGFLFALMAHIFVYIFNSEELLPRAGTFEEGNFAGLYYILTFNLICYKHKNHSKDLLIYGLMCGLGVLLSDTTIGVFVFIANINFIIFKNYSVIGRTYIIIIFLLMLFLVINFNINHFYDKIFVDSSAAYSFSKYDRISSFNAGLEIFQRYPIFGLGVEAYGFLVNDYLDQSEVKFYDFSFRRIPNNVYIEILSEFGLLGSVIFWPFFINLKKTLTRCSFTLTAGVISILLYWIAFPTFSVAYIWVYLGFCFASKNDLVISVKA